MQQTPPSALVETQRATVNAWQCDYNHHLNFQFYCREFDQAARFLALSCGADPAGPLPQGRHLRFHAELVAGDIFRVASARIVDGPHTGSLVHWMSHAGTGRLIATALDSGAPDFACPEVPESAVASALPRSVEVREGALPFAMMGKDGWEPTARGWVTPDRCTPGGELTEQHLAGLLGDAAGHVWERAGAGVVWVRENGLGRIAVEAKITHFAPARAGDLLMLHSRVGPASGKAVPLQHHLHRLPDGLPVARADVTALLIDMKTRKTVPLPSGVRRIPD